MRGKRSLKICHHQVNTFYTSVKVFFAQIITSTEVFFLQKVAFIKVFFVSSRPTSHSLAKWKDKEEIQRKYLVFSQ